MLFPQQTFFFFSTNLLKTCQRPRLFRGAFLRPPCLSAIGGCTPSAQRACPQEPPGRPQPAGLLAGANQGRPGAKGSSHLQVGPRERRGVDQMTFLLCGTPTLGTLPELSPFVKTAV